MNKKGFTLIELIIVIALMAILMAFAAPSMIQWRESAQVKEVARDILGGLRQARSIAITNNQNVTATIDPDGHTLTFGTRTLSFPSRILLQATTNIDTSANPPTASGWSGSDDKSTEFRPQGSATNSLWIRVNNDDRLIVKITSTASGLAKID
ncbi:MAG: GspH/FimT family pseudopilin [Desulfuromonadaceae bacterium]|nr:GspH/FimT family pseudopilin [Desulfuromonadaceae bacterium]